MKIRRRLYNDLIDDTLNRKALSLFIFMKNRFKSSVVHNFSYAKIAKLANVHQNTAKKYIRILLELELVKRCGSNNQHLLFCSAQALKKAKANVRFSKFDFTSIKSIEIGLVALYIVETQKRKLYIKHKVENNLNPKKKYFTKGEYNNWRKDSNFCKKRGLTKFNDNGISYSYIAKKLNVGRNLVSEAIKSGELLGFFTKHRNQLQLYLKNGVDLCFKYSDKGFHFHTKNNLYIIKANTYTLSIG